MANCWPHLLQTTVSIRIAFGGCSASRPRRLATPFGFTSAALDADGNCDRRLVRHRGIRSAEFEGVTHSRWAPDLHSPCRSRLPWLFQLLRRWASKQSRNLGIVRCRDRSRRWHSRSCHAAQTETGARILSCWKRNCRRKSSSLWFLLLCQLDLAVLSRNRQARKGELVYLSRGQFKRQINTNTESCPCAKRRASRLNANLYRTIQIRMQSSWFLMIR